MKETDYLLGNEKIIDDLKKMPIFRPFTQSDLQTLLNMSKLRTYKSGETIIQEGNIDSWVYFLIYGKVKIVKKNKEVTILKRKGDIFGEMRFIDSSPRSASAYADGDVACIAVDTEYVEKLTGNDKVAFGYIMYRVFSEILANRLRSLTRELITLKGKDASGKWMN
ncbi:MAG: cyclic nucleotide-binding domain-containing protein [Deltaproteobacteria bacterium]|nr:MAG: cyclic nucleotide-binding domain-containing protein [Deltaproteobacteria bacterium]